MEATIDVRGLLAQTITGTFIALQEELGKEEPGEEALVMYKSLLDNIVAYTALCRHTPDGCTDWIDRTRGVDVNFIQKVLNDYEVVKGLTELGVDTDGLVGLLPVEKSNTVSELLAAATGDVTGGYMNAPAGTGWEVPKSFIASVLPMTQQDSTNGLDHCVSILTKVFVRLSYKFIGKTYDEANKIVNELLRTRSSEVADCMKVDDSTEPTVADTITASESLCWLAAYMTTGAVGTFNLAYAGYDIEDKYVMVRPKEWNCMKTSSASTMLEYPNYGFVKEGNGRDIPIVASSLDTLKVTMQEGQL